MILWKKKDKRNYNKKSRAVYKSNILRGKKNIDQIQKRNNLFTKEKDNKNISQKEHRINKWGVILRI